MCAGVWAGVQIVLRTRTIFHTLCTHKITIYFNTQTHILTEKRRLGRQQKTFELADTHTHTRKNAHTTSVNFSICAQLDLCTINDIDRLLETHAIPSDRNSWTGYKCATPNRNIQTQNIRRHFCAFASTQRGNTDELHHLFIVFTYELHTIQIYIQTKCYANTVWRGVGSYNLWNGTGQRIVADFVCLTNPAAPSYAYIIVTRRHLRQQVVKFIVITLWREC